MPPPDSINPDPASGDQPGWPEPPPYFPPTPAQQPWNAWPPPPGDVGTPSWGYPSWGPPPAFSPLGYPPPPPLPPGRRSRSLSMWTFVAMDLAVGLVSWCGGTLV